MVLDVFPRRGWEVYCRKRQTLASVRDGRVKYRAGSPACFYILTPIRETSLNIVPALPFDIIFSRPSFLERLAAIRFKAKGGDQPQEIRVNNSPGDLTET